MTTTPLRLVLIGNFLSATLGGRSVCEELAEAFRARGHTVITASDEAAAPRRLWHMLTTVWRARRSCDAVYCDVYSGRGFVWAEWVTLLASTLGLPVALALRGGNLPAYAAAHPSRVRRLLHRATVVVAPSGYLARACAALRNDIVCIPNGIPVQRYAGFVRTRMRPRLVWMRSLHAIYNPTMAVEVLARVREVHPDATLVMAGRDKGDGSRAAVVRRAADLGVTDAVSLPGDVPKAQLPALLADADLFINTTDIDNQPVSVIEAMAAGLCVVTTNVGGIPDLCEDGVTARLVAPGAVDAMSAACLALLADPAAAQRLSQAALTAAAGYDWTQTLEAWEAQLAACARR